jgi:hypothetical protein
MTSRIGKLGNFENESQKKSFLVDFFVVSPPKYAKYTISDV